MYKYISNITQYFLQRFDRKLALINLIFEHFHKYLVTILSMTKGVFLVNHRCYAVSRNKCQVFLVNHLFTGPVVKIQVQCTMYIRVDRF